MQRKMDAEHSSDATVQSITEHSCELLIKQDKNHVSQVSSTYEDYQPRKRSRSVLHWVQKTFNNIASSHPHHDKSYTRERSATTTTTSIPYVRSSPTRERPPVSQAFKNSGRPRASTLDSIPSTDKKSHRAKKIISSTDAQAQQSPSIFQFMLGH